MRFLFLSALLVSCQISGDSAKVHGPDIPRTLAEFEAHSGNLTAKHSVAKLTDFDPIVDWSAILQTTKGHDEPETQPWDRPLFLHGITHLDAAQAREIAQFKGGRLFLPDLVSLDEETAVALAASGKELHLHGLQSLDVPTARALVAGGPGRLRLDGLQSISVEVAEELAKLEGSLDLSGLHHPSLEVVQALGKWEGWGEQIILRVGLVDPTPEQIVVFAANKGWGLAFDGMREMSVEQARAFRRVARPQISFNGLTRLSDEVADEIGNWNAKFLVLGGLTTLSSQQLVWLEKGSVALALRSLPADSR